MCRINLLLATLCMLAATQLYAQQKDLPENDVINTVLIEQQAIELALKNNPNLAQMQARYEAITKIPSQQGSLPDPIITLGAMSYPTDTFHRDQEAMTQFQIGVSQAFPFPGKLGLREEAAEFDAKAAYYAVEEMRLVLTSNVSNKWWQVFYLDRALDTVDTNHTLLRQFIAVAETKYTTGKGLQQDVLLSQLELSRLTDKKIQIEAMRTNHSIQLNILMDLAPRNALLLPKTSPTSRAKIRSEQTLYHLAENSRPRLHEKRQLDAAATSRLDLAKRGYYPDFNVSLTYGDRNGQNPIANGGDRADLVSLMIGIKIPLYAGTKQSATVQQRTREKMKSHYSLMDERNQVMADIASNITDYQRAQQQLSLFTTGILPQARQTVQSMLAGYQVSEVDFLNLVRSQVTLLNYELQYWKSLTESYQALARLQASIGKESIYE
jgi:cobalt-zinc-cadmium efflux system outer membrane protein